MKKYPTTFNIDDKFIHKDGWSFLINKSKIYKIVDKRLSKNKIIYEYKLSINGLNDQLYWMDQTDIAKQFILMELAYDNENIMLF